MIHNHMGVNYSYAHYNIISAISAFVTAEIYFICIS